MKKLFRLLALLIVSVFLCPSGANAQGAPEMSEEQMLEMLTQQFPKLPLDKSIRVGKLSNGLTYYIRYNDYPKGQADFYIAQKVGSILEEDNQRGLAHFLEHMCFNGTKHFPGNSLREYLASVGVKFGQNLNAYTSIEETVYNISNVPTARVGVQDSCLLILHDWANDLLLEDAEIDKERTVIHEEWRQSNKGSQRVLESLLPTMYPDSKYGYRLPIGTMDVVDNFPYKALRDYYETWYRPDQQAIVVVGDIDVDRIEAKIKEIFADIEMPANAPERTYLPVADHKGTIYAIGHDPEQQNNRVNLMWLSDPLPPVLKNTLYQIQIDYMEQMITDMLDNRFNDMSSDPNCPFAVAGCYYGEYLVSKTKDAFNVIGIAKGNTKEDSETTLASIYREVLRAAKGGFTASEYDRVRDTYLAHLESAYNNRATIQSETYVNACVRNFIDEEPLLSIEDEYELMKMLAPQITVEMLNEVFGQSITEDNRVVYAVLSDNPEGQYPSQENFTAVLDNVSKENIEVFQDNVKTEPLIAQMPAPGRIVAEKPLKEWGATEWTLSNGVKVIVKKTDFKQDEIRLWAGAVGGYAGLADSYAPTVKMLSYSVGSCGLGAYTNNDLRKYLSGKKASLSADFAPYTRDFTGSTTPKDLQTLMELVYMNFTDMSLTPDEFAALQNTLVGALQNQEATPEFKFSQYYIEKLYASPLEQVLTVSSVKEASREQTLEVIHDMTKNAADYTFVIVGNYDEAALRPLVEQYVASLPADPKTAVKKVGSYNPAFAIATGTGVDIKHVKMETPMSYAAVVETGRMPYTMKNTEIANICGQILSARLINTVREEMGAVYSIGASASMRRIAGKNNFTLSTVFPFKPELQKEVFAEIKKQIEDMQNNVSEEELAKVKEFLVKEYTEAKTLNGSWMGSIAGWTRNGVDTFNGDIETVNSITVKDVENYMKKIVSQRGYRVVILAPEK